LGRQISAILTQLDAKKRDFYEFVARELQELQDCGKVKEVLISFDFYFAQIFSAEFI
jgi:kinesin family protein 16B